MTDIRLAYNMHPSASKAVGEPQAPDDRPALLVSYVYLAPFLKARHQYAYRDWSLDSGAFSAFHSGTVIDLDAYTETCRELLDTDPTLTEVFALDVLGDHVASLRNAEAMWKKGVPAIPCYHHGEPEAALLALRDYPKVALGGSVGLRSTAKLRWATQCFARLWPKPIHGFGFGTEAHILALPFHSVDATNWEAGPCRFGQWKQFGTLSLRGSKQNLRGEVDHYLDIERRARVRWAKQMQELQTIGPAVRLAADFGAAAGQRIAATLAPTVRLAAQANDTRKKPWNLSDGPTVRLACANSPAERNGTLGPRKDPP